MSTKTAIQSKVPYIPETAPFNEAQRAWLNGFLAGMFSHSGSPVTQTQAQEHSLHNKPPVTILFGSQTGNAEALSKQTLMAAKEQGFEASIVDMDDYDFSKLKEEKALLIITSTYGEGEPPDNALCFWEELNSENAPQLQDLKYAILALGDTNYEQFCEFGKQCDRRFSELGATALTQRVDCDVDYDELYVVWVKSVFSALSTSNDNPIEIVPIDQTDSEEMTAEKKELPKYSKSHPYHAQLISKKQLTAAGSQKEVFHVEISLKDSGLTYECGDVLGILPRNNPVLAENLLKMLNFTGDEIVKDNDGNDIDLHSLLMHQKNINSIQMPLLKYLAQKTKDNLLKELLEPGSKAILKNYTDEREILDLLKAYPGNFNDPTEFVETLGKLQPRLYSIASSPATTPDEVHLTVGVVRYENQFGVRHGVCSTFLADQIEPEKELPVFFKPAKKFGLPKDNDRDIIMVGPGTGIAPFRGFLHERKATGANGRNWLFFGSWEKQYDFLYKDEIEDFRNDGILTNLDLAFSRDQNQKIYVQDKMMERSKELYEWLENGACFYVCGDASRMARDVNQALIDIIVNEGNKSTKCAESYIKKMSKENRYCRDVY